MAMRADRSEAVAGPMRWWRRPIPHHNGKLSACDGSLIGRCLTSFHHSPECGGVSKDLDAIEGRIVGSRGLRERAAGGRVWLIRLRMCSLLQLPRRQTSRTDSRSRLGRSKREGSDSAFGPRGDGSPNLHVA